MQSLQNMWKHRVIVCDLNFCRQDEHFSMRCRHWMGQLLVYITYSSGAYLEKGILFGHTLDISFDIATLTIGGSSSLVRLSFPFLDLLLELV